MADEIVSINNLKENLLEFELTVKGLTEENFDTKFVIHSSDMELAFPCKKGDNGKWSVTLPPLPMLERTAYPFHLQVVAEGFQFRPLRGSVNIVGSPEVYASTSVTNKKLESPTKPVVVKETTKVAPTRVDVARQREKPVEQVARELMEANKPKAKAGVVVEAAVIKSQPVVKESLLPTIKDEPKAEAATAVKDKAARKVLEDLGLKSKTSKPKRRFSLKN